MADQNVKQIQVVPGGGAEGGGEGARRRSRKGKKKLQVGGEGEAAGAATPTLQISKVGGGSTSPGTMVQLAASHVSGGPPGAEKPGPVTGVNSALTQAGAAAGGGAQPQKPVKVVLAASKKKKGHVVLAAAKPAATAAASSQTAKTRKVSKARKIKVSMKTLRKKIHRAKTLRTTAEKATVEEIKKELHKAGILKAESKAPEGILRQMYADFLTLKARAL